MVAATRLAEKNALLHILNDILNLEACEYEIVTSPLGLILFTPLEVEDVEYMEGTVQTKLNKGHKGLIYALQAMAIHGKKLDGDTILEDWSNVTREDLNEYRASKMYLSARAGLPNPNPTTAGAITLLHFVRPRDPLGEYWKGVRRDPNAFVSLKEDKQWDSWEQSTVAQAQAQDLSDVLDSTFVPATPEATELFVEKQKFVYAIFDKILLTDKGKSLVRQYFDAQKVSRDLTVYSNTLTMAARVASDLLTYIMSSNSVMAHERAQHKALFSTGKTRLDNMSLFYQPMII
jgi:hypothetical protein